MSEISRDKMKPYFFRTPAKFRDWLAKNHVLSDELLVGFYKKNSGKPGITWPESVDQALCFGWIDGVRKNMDDESYSIRFTPRKPGSTWSSVNIERAEALIADGRMQPAGLKAYKARREGKSRVYSYEQRSIDLEEPYRGLLKKNKTAWNFFQSQPSSYRRKVCWWIENAKKQETRQKRFEQLADYSAAEQKLPQFVSRKPQH
ncbi:MAG: YdeI/OmpD-associated family protein [Gammaproteobacteria bacterium]